MLSSASNSITDSASISSTVSQHEMTNSESAPCHQQRDGGAASANSDPSNPAPNPFKFIAEPVLYKTKMCRNFLRDGYCAYETKCMFAHGKFDLRQADQNEKDGLMTEELVKRFQTKSIIEYRKKTRSESPPPFNEAVLMCAETATPPTRCASAPVSPQLYSNEPLTPPLQCAFVPNAMMVVGSTRPIQHPPMSALYHYPLPLQHQSYSHSLPPNNSCSSHYNNNNVIDQPIFANLLNSSINSGFMPPQQLHHHNAAAVDSSYTAAPSYSCQCPSCVQTHIYQQQPAYVSAFSYHYSATAV